MATEDKFCVLVDRETKRTSIITAAAYRAACLPTALLKFDPSKTIVIADDFSEEDAKRYARMNNPDAYAATEQQARDALAGDAVDGHQVAAHAARRPAVQRLERRARAKVGVRERR